RITPMKRRPTPALVLALAALGVAAVGFAKAAIPGSDGTIHACYNTDGSLPGQLHVVDEGQSCSGGQHSLNWPAQGRPGAAGPALWHHVYLKASYPILADHGWKAIAVWQYASALSQAPQADWTIRIHLHCWRQR